MEERITIEDVQKLQEAVEKMQNQISEIVQMKERLTGRINKPAKEINGEDIDVIEKLKGSVNSLHFKNSNVDYLVEKVQSVEKRKERYNLVDLEDLDIEEENGYFEQAQQLVKQIESISKKTENFQSLCGKLDKKVDMHKVEESREEIKDDFLEAQENPHCIVMHYGNNRKVISDKERKLMEKGLLLTPAYIVQHDVGPHGDHTYSELKHYAYSDLKFSEYDEATLEQKQKIREKEKRISDIRESTDKVYDKKGKVEIPIRMKIEFFYDEVIPDLSVLLETTQRELANAGIEPQDYNFEKMPKKSLINSEQISKLDEDMALTTTEVGGIRGLINRIKEFFKEKGGK